MSIRVCVIGAGAAGLNCLRHLKTKPNVFQAVVFEQSSSLGGTWVYTDRTGKDDNGMPIHSSMYQNLRTNLPKEVMGFPDFPFPKEGPSFIGHIDVCKYLDDYANHFDIRKYIKFNTNVKNVCPVKEINDPQKVEWKVTIHDSGKPEREEVLHFDAVIVCNGHNFDPVIPEISGMESFTGQFIHSHEYRYPEIFKDQRVLCLGAGSSGKDIAIDLAPYAKEIHLSHRKPVFPSPLPQNVYQIPGTKEIKQSSVILNNDTVIDNIDTIIFCTGYHHSFPFLASDCHVSIDKYQRVTPLYQHVIHTEYPTMSFIGIPKVICPFPLFDCQVQLILASLDGSMSLPSQDEMNKDIEEDFQSRIANGQHQRFSHLLGPKQWEYNDKLATLGGFTKIQRVTQKLYEEVHRKRDADLTKYRYANYDVINSNEFKVLNN